MDIEINRSDNYDGNMGIREERAQLFSKYVSAEVKGAIIAREHTVSDVALAIGHHPPTLTNWLNAKRELPLSVMAKVCEEIGVEPGTITQRAYDRLVYEEGEWRKPGDITKLSAVDDTLPPVEELAANPHQLDSEQGDHIDE